MHNVSRNLHISRLSQSMYAFHSLSLRSRIELGFHDKDFVGTCEVKTKTTSTDGDKNDGYGRVITEDVQILRAMLATHGPIKTSKAEAVSFECVLNQI